MLLLLEVVVAGALLAFVTAQLVLRRRRQRRDERAHAANLSRGLHLPPSLHPVIDTDICIGSLACLQACPEGDILGIIGGAARLVHATQCIGHGACATSCPVGAIKLVFGTAERGVDLPEVDERFESSRRGVHVIGELGGMGLVKNAVEQGLQCAGFLVESLGQTAARGELADVAIVGAGPAGLSAALALQQRGLAVRLLEQGRFGGAVASYPRQKLVMTEPLTLPGGERLKARVVAKEELLAFFTRAATRAGLRVDEGARVTGLTGEDGAFTLQTEAGSVLARKVILATGRRGSPRKLGVPGEALPKVAYSLTEPEQYDGARVLVVGGGDSAVEAACQLAEEGRAQVSLSYRSPELGRCRPPNRARAEALAAQGKLLLLLPSEVRAVTAEEVVLSASGAEKRLPNDFVLACLGGELPLEFLGKVGVGVRRHFGETLRAAEGEAPRRLRSALSKEHAARVRARKRALLYGATGVLILGWLWWAGKGYYLMPRAQRLQSPLHETLKPAGSFGHGVGIAATVVMLSNFLYALRKRWGRMARAGPLRGWLDFHVFVGFLSPAVIAFHAAFQSNNQLATTTAASLVVVMATGIVGRYLYGLVPGGGEQKVELADLLGQWERLEDRLRPLAREAKHPEAIEALLVQQEAPAQPAPLLLQLARLPWASVRLRLRVAAAALQLPAEVRREFREAVLRLSRLRAQIGLFASIKQLMRAWRIFHASLAVLLVFAIAAHVAVSLYLGYGLLR